MPSIQTKKIKFVDNQSQFSLQLEIINTKSYKTQKECLVLKPDLQRSNPRKKAFIFLSL